MEEAPDRPQKNKEEHKNHKYFGDLSPYFLSVL
jgi:hypothetical protein